MIKPQDLQIFIATFNRPAYLKNSLESILAQTVQGFELTILDNSDNSETQEAVKPYLSETVKYVRTQPLNNPSSNFYKAREIADKKYVMSFHDDDQMNPRYIESVLAVINEFKNVNIVTGKCTNFYGEKLRSFPQNFNRKAVVLENKAEFAAYLFAYGKGGANTPATVYRTDYFKTADPLLHFHKNADWPFAIEGLMDGKAVVIHDDYCVLTRQHPGQDSGNSQRNGTELPNLFAWMEYFTGYLKPNDPQSPYRNMYRVYVYNMLKGLYNYLKPSEKAAMSWEALLEEAKKRGMIDEIAVNKGNYRKNLFSRLLTAPYRLANKFDIKSKIKRF
ncbi:glycosyltransferase involved in cell wall biosynthesis [Elusimicrobium posterum]|uniref:glycosyltransferase family 2 protein n=1 Tax=Elusimicrobium posterum TaxID=3116653 RepID=UPI003C76880C